jgi:hypothetical protein
MVLLRMTFISLPVLALAACNTPAPQANQASYQSLPAGVSPNNFRLPDQPGCQGDVARFQALIDNDLATGHTTQSVRDAVTADLSKAQAACTAGRSAEASSMVTSIRKKFGYPGS